MIFAQVEIPSVKVVDSTLHEIVYFGVLIAITILASAYGLEMVFKTLQRFGLIKGDGNGNKTNVDNNQLASVVQDGVRSEVRAELQIIAATMNTLRRSIDELKESSVRTMEELKQSNNKELQEINKSLIKLITLEETRLQFETGRRPQ